MEKPMNIDELIKKVAKMWVDGGGDIWGMEWAAGRIKDAISAEHIERQAERNDIILFSSFKQYEYIRNILVRISDCAPASYDEIGGGTCIRPSIQVQLIKDAREALKKLRHL